MIDLVLVVEEIIAENFLIFGETSLNANLKQFKRSKFFPTG